jgi:hypothetical protein
MIAGTPGPAIFREAIAVRTGMARQSIGSRCLVDLERQVGARNASGRGTLFAATGTDTDRIRPLLRSVDASPLVVNQQAIAGKSSDALRMTTLP